VTDVELTVFSKYFVRYPIWYARYQYAGERYFVGISGVSGVCLIARHPWKLLAGITKLGGLIAGETRWKKEASPVPREEQTPARDETRTEEAPRAETGAGDLSSRFRAHVERERGKS
jgi:hypothetical protein